MKILMARAGALARAERRRVIARIADGLSSRLQGVRVIAGDAEVELRGAGLVRRWLTDPALRFLSDGRP